MQLGRARAPGGDGRTSHRRIAHASSARSQQKPAWPFPKDATRLNLGERD
jgi:hypothetical protein